MEDLGDGGPLGLLLRGSLLGRGRGRGEVLTEGIDVQRRETRVEADLLGCR